MSFHRLKTDTPVHMPVVTALLLCVAALLVLFLFPVSAAETTNACAARIVLTEKAGVISAALQLRGENFSRTQCAALSFDSTALTLLASDGVTTPAAPASAGTLTVLPKGTYTVMKNGFTESDLSAEYGVLDGRGILLLYPTAETPISYTAFTTVMTVQLARSADVPLTASSIRLVTYEEQRAIAQSAKLMLATSDSYMTFGSLNGGDTLSEPAFSGHKTITGARGEDTLQEAVPWSNPFSDIYESMPYYDAIAYVAQNSLFVGDSTGKFLPEASMTRATFAAVLCRLAGDENAVLSNPPALTQAFTDVAPDAWYAPYIAWATDIGLLLGYGDGRFGADDPVTREQMYLLIQRFTDQWGYHTADWQNVSLSSISDADKISAWDNDAAVSAVKFAFANGLLIADENRAIHPTEAAPRWTLAVLLYNLSKIERPGTGTAVVVDVMNAASIPDCPPTTDALVQGAYQKIYEGLLSLTAKINLSAFHLNYEQFLTVYQEAAKQAEFFYVGNLFNYSYSRITGEILSVTPTYTMRGTELVAAQRDFQARLDEILSLVDRSLTPLEQVLFLHDYLAVNFVYDETTGSFDAYAFLTSGRGVCQGYTLTMQALLDALGIPCSRVTSAEMNHTWNLVQLNGIWYHMDVTWDDPQPDQHGQVHHTYFLKSDAYMQSHEHSGWYSFASYTAADTQYDSYFFTNVRTPLVRMDNGLWYYISNTSGTLNSWDIAAGKRAKVCDTGIKWVTADGTYKSMYTGLVRTGDMLLYNGADAVYAYHIDTGVTETVYQNSTGGYICGLTLESYSASAGAQTTDHIVFQIKSSPADKTGTLQRIPTENLFTYTLTGVVSGYFSDASAKISLLRNGTTYKTTDTARSGVCIESEMTFTIDGIKPGRYDLLIEKKGCFSYTVKNIVISGYTDLTALANGPDVLPLLGGDLNGDGVIGGADRTLLLGKNTFHRKKDTALTPSADLNGDGIIDIIDYAILTGADRWNLKKTDNFYQIPA